MAWRDLPKNFHQAPRREPPDRKTEAEAASIRFFRNNEIGPKTLGRRISKEKRQHDGRLKTAELKSTIRQAELVKSYTWTPPNVRILVQK